MSSLTSTLVGSTSTSETTWTLEQPGLDAGNAGGETLPLTLASASSGYVDTWAKGVTVLADGTISGWYDVNKEWGGIDNNMCWAAAASNVIAWWQQTYQTVSYAYTSSVPTDVEDVFATMKRNWANVGGSSTTAFEWWLSGENRDYGSYIGAPAAGGYYERVDTSNLVDDYTLSGVSAADTGSLLANAFVQGGGVSLSINRYDGSSFYAGHAITLWGVTQDAETGYLTSIHVTDSDDGKDGIFTVDVVYDSWSGNYVLLGDRFQNYYLTGCDVLRSFSRTDTTAPAAPTELALSVNGVDISFSWKGVQDSSGVVYEVSLLELVGNTWYIQQPFVATSESLTTTWFNVATLRWRVRAKDGAGNVSDWVYGDTFEYTATPPSISMEDTQLNVLGDNRTEVTLSWTGSEGCTYELTLDGTTHQLGSQLSFTTTLADGIYDYSITATDAAGYSTTRRGDTFACDTMAPTDPTGLTMQLTGGKAVFSWSPSTDANGIKEYHFVCFMPDGLDDFYDWDVTGESYTLDLPVEGDYSWAVCAVDGSGDSSQWQYGEWFTVDLSAPTFTLNEVSTVKTSAGSTRVTFSWSANESLNYTLTLNGKTYSVGGVSSYSLNLTDGDYQYSVTATDAAGNSTTEQGKAFSTDATAPTKPTSLQVKQSGTNVLFSWGASTDAGGGVTYDLAYKLTTASSLSYSTGLSSTSKSLALSAGTYTWAVRAKDSKGNTTDWVWGSNLSMDSTAPTLPTSLTVKQSGDNTILSWGASTDASGGVTYELAYKLSSASGYTYTTLSGTSKTLSLPAGAYKWAVRAKDVHGNTSSWVWGSDFTKTAAAPTKPTSLTVKQVAGDAIFSWGASTGSGTVTYDLAYKMTGSSSFSYRTGLTTTSKAVNLPTGNYTWAVRAKDAQGNTTDWVWGAALSKDSTAPTKPTSLQAKQSGVNATFSWGASSDASGVTYDLAYKMTGSSSYSYSNGLTSASKTLSLPAGVYTWAVRANDAYGNTTGWVWGSQYTQTTSTLTLPTSLTVKQVAGDAVFSWAASTGGSGVTYDLAYKVAGSSSFSYRTGLTSTSKAVNLPTGTYTWAVRAKDSQGNTTDWAWGSTLNKDSTVPTKPTSLQAKQSGVNATFSWGASSDTSGGVTYELAYKLTTASGYTYSSGLTGTSKTLSLSAGTYKWAVRATDRYGNTTGWVWGSDFNQTTATLTTPSSLTVKQVAGDAVFSWAASTGGSGVTYDLAYKVAGSSAFSYRTGLTSTSKAVNLPTGTYTWAVRAKDAQGNTTDWAWGATLNKDSTAPTNPSSLQVTLSGGNALFSWKRSTDESGVTYDLAYKLTSASGYTYSTGLSSTSKILSLPTGSYTWAVRAKDSYGNSTGWVWGQSFSNSSASSAGLSTGLDQELALSAGTSCLAANVRQPVALADYSLELGLQKEGGQTLAQSMLA